MHHSPRLVVMRANKKMKKPRYLSLVAGLEVDLDLDTKLWVSCSSFITWGTFIYTLPCL